MIREDVATEVYITTPAWSKQVYFCNTKYMNDSNNTIKHALMSYKFINAICSKAYRLYNRGILTPVQ